MAHTHSQSSSKSGKKTSSTKSKSLSDDDAPELTAEVAARAQISKGGKVIRKATGTLTKSHVDASGNEANPNASKPHVATLNKERNNMADNNGLPSVIEFDEDIGNAEAPVPLPVGDYPAEIRAATHKTSQSSGNPYAAVQFYISSDAYPADYTEGEPDGMLLTFNRVSLLDTPQSRHRLRKFLESIGAPTGKKVDLNDWVGRTATITIQHDTFEGETRAQIGKVSAA